MFSGPATGLFTSPNPFSVAPAGSLKVADNLVFSAPCVIEPRRGFAEMSASSFGSTGSLADAIAFYGTSILVAYDLTTVAIRPEAGTFTDFGAAFSPNGNNRMRFEGAARSVFFNADKGIQVYDGTGVSGQPTFAGCQQGLNIIATQSYDDGWQEPDTAVAYRFTVCRKDAWGRIIEGPPSGRVVVGNNLTVSAAGLTLTANVVTAVYLAEVLSPEFGEVVVMQPPSEGTAFVTGNHTITTTGAGTFRYAQAHADAVAALNHVFVRGTATSNTVKCYLPAQNLTDCFLRVYRSEMTLAADDIPSDELFQCYESAYVSAAQVAAGYVEFDDVAPESVLEVPLYTNPNTGDGTLAANYAPPIAEDIAYWQDRMWYLNTTEKQSLQLALIGVGSPDGLQDGDTFSFLLEGGTAPADLLTFTAKLAPSSSLEFQLYPYGDPGTNIQLTAQALCQCINESGLGKAALYVSSETGQPGKLLLTNEDDGTNAPYQTSFKLYSDRATCWTPQLPDGTTPLWVPPESTNNRHAARLWCSKLGQPEAVPLLNYIQIDADNNAALRMMALNYRMLIWKTDGLYYVPNTFPLSMQKLSDHVLIAPDSVARLGDAVYFLSDEGLMAVDDSGVHPISTAINDTFNALGGPTSLEDLQQRTFGCAYRSARQYLLWTIQKEDDAFSADNEQAFVYSTLANSGFTRYGFGVRCAGVAPSTDQLVVAPTDDNVLWLERKSLTDTDYADANGEAIDTELVFNDFTEGEPAVMKMAQQASFLFTENGMNTITAKFASEVHPSPLEVEIETEGWGEFAWGETAWGGFIRSIRRVEPLPVGAANCCQLSVGFSTSQVNAKFKFIGIDIISKGDTVANRG